MNYSWARKTAQTGFVAAGAVLVAGAGTAQAWGPDVTTQDQVGAVSGNQVVAPIQAPSNICGVAAAVLGTASAGCEGGADADYDGAGDLTTQDNTGLGNGNQAFAPVQAPTDISGIATAVGGVAYGYSTGGSHADVESGAEASRNGESDTLTQHNVGALSGNQLLAPIQAPVNTCGNAVAVGGVSDAGCEGGADADYSGAGDLTSQDNVGLGNGSQLFAPVQAPVNVCGNAIAIFGTADASCEGGSDAEVPGGHDHHDSHKELSSTESSNMDVNEEQLPAVPGLDAVSGATGSVPVVGGIVGNTTSEGVADTVAGVTELAGAGIL